MTRALVLAMAATLTAAASAAQTQPDARVKTWTGWFSDKQCARTPAAGERVRPNGSDCVKKCLDGGSTPVFLSEQANAIYEVRDHARVRDDVGHRVELTGIVDEHARTIEVRSVKRLSEVPALCLAPPRGAKK